MVCHNKIIKPSPPIIDKYNDKGVFTSIKSLDLDASSYQNAAGLRACIMRYLRKIAGFAKGEKVELDRKRIFSSDVKARVLELAIPHEGSAMQHAVLKEMIEEAEKLGVQLKSMII